MTENKTELLPILTGHRGNNADLIAQVSKMYIKKGMKIADVTFGKGNFWKKVDLINNDFFPSDLQTGTDFRRLPYEDRIFDILVLDPPYMHGGSTVKYSINECYKNEVIGHESVIRLYTGGILEAARVLKKGGQLWLKCQDENDGGKQKLSSHELKTISEILGFVVKDIFVLVSNSIPAMRENYQKTARKNHSYLYILEFRR